MLRVDFFCRIIFFSFPLFIISCNQEEIDSLNSQLESSSNTINRLENRILELEDELDNIESERDYYYRSWQTSEQNHEQYVNGNGICLDAYYPNLGYKTKICGASNIIDALR